MKDIKRTVARNISELRVANHMTQLELSEKINYSDKAISKWERAESTPDISVLLEMAELFGVTLDYFVKEEHEEPSGKQAEKTDTEDVRYNRKAIAYVSESCAWVIAILAFVVTTLVLKRVTFQFLYFVYALPVALIVKLVFNSIWFEVRHNYYIISALVWSLLASVQITFFYFGINIALIYLLGVALQAVIVLWSFIGKPQKQKK